MEILGLAKDGERRFTLREAQDRADECDVFVSHKSDDKGLAMEVYNCIKGLGLGLRPWIDLQDPNIHGDSARLDAYIKGVISQSASLLAVVTEVTNESWWVPFEVGIAYDQNCWLATFVQDREGVALPSFLSKHPRLKRHEPDLHNWCLELAQRKHDLALLTKRAGDVLRPSRADYIREMADLTTRFR
ncbi:MAG: TIR domain-containing protein [Gammaproteobacteria bacterium]|nr:TIR domain-containing protein [Gammaproteobacteria bacterium]